MNFRRVASFTSFSFALTCTVAATLDAQEPEAAVRPKKGQEQETAERTNKAQKTEAAARRKKAQESEVTARSKKAQESEGAERTKKAKLSEAGAVSKKAGESGNSALPEVVVKATPEEQGYAATTSTLGTKTETRLLETPQAVSVVTRQLMEDQGTRRLNEALSNVAGVTVGGVFSSWDYYRIRGFDSAFTSFTDGLRGEDGTNEELWGLERVEVVKGPASTLYGYGPLGGMVNLVSKRPRPENFVNTHLGFGSYDFYEPAVDMGFTLPNKKAYFRLNALYESERSFVDFAGKQRIYVAPSATFELGDNTTLTLLASYKEDWIDNSFPLPARGTVLPNEHGRIPLNRYIGDPDNRNNIHERYYRAGWELKHRFNDVFSFRSNGAAIRSTAVWKNLLYPSFLADDDRTLFTFPYGLDAVSDGTRLDSAVDAKFSTGPVKHQVTVGWDYRYNRYSSINKTTVDPNASPTIDMFNPHYASIDMPKFTDVPRFTDRNYSSGVYVQEQAKIDRFTLTLGGRYDWSWTEENDDAQKFSPRIGATYEFVHGLALYANYSQSFNPQWFSKDSAGKAVVPETGEIFEVGLKAELIEGKLTGMLSLYDLTRKNVATSNLATPDPFDAIASGEQHSRGVELEIAWRPMPGWDFTMAYTYTDAEISEDAVLPIGDRPLGVPEHAFSAWTKYTIQNGALRGLGFGIGGRYYTAQAGDLPNTFELPPHGVLNAAVSYERGPFSAQLNIENLLDREYFSGANDVAYVLPGNPLTLRAEVGWKF